MIVDILGTEYTVTRNTSAIGGMGADGICQAYNRKIIYRDLKDFLEDIDSVSAKKLRRDEVIRHEVIHAFFAESGLSKYGDDEVLVDWIAKQMPTEEGGSGTYLYQMECETVGTDGNKHFGDLTAIEFITNLEIARLTEVLIPAEDEEETEALRARYFSSFETAPFGGNKKDYKEKANKLNGVGDTKVIPAWDGGGTVKLIIINSDFDKASDTLVSEVQEAMDPLSDRGNGSGIAPIGHTVTVVTIKEVPITVSVNIVYKEGYSWSRLGEDIKAAIEAYLLEMRKDWANQSFLSVRITQVEARLLKIEGIVDISDTKINGVADNFTLASDEIPVPSETGVVVDA